MYLAQPTPQSDEDYCAGYEVLSIAQSVGSTTGESAGLVNDLISKTPVKFAPQVWGFQLAVGAIERISGGSSLIIGAYKAYRYGDGAALCNGTIDAFAGGLAAAG